MYGVNVQEALRLYPAINPAYVQQRVALQDTSLGSHYIPKGTTGKTNSQVFPQCLKGSWTYFVPGNSCMLLMAAQFLLTQAVIVCKAKVNNLSINTYSP